MKWYSRQAKKSFEAQNNCCFYCYQELFFISSRTKDHFIPVSRGFSIKNNIVIACNSCNVEKQNNLPCPKTINRYIDLWNSIGNKKAVVVYNEYMMIQKVIDKIQSITGIVFDPSFRYNDIYYQ